MKLLLKILFLLGFCVSVAKAQLYVKGANFTTRDGLSDNRVRCILKDKTGFVWLGTWNGLNRYDGNSFKIYRPDLGNSISNEVINDLEVDSSGHIWVATMDGLNKFNPRTNTWTNYLPEQSNSVPSNLIWDLHADEQDRLWIVSDVKDLTSLDINTGKFIRYNWTKFASSVPELAKGNYISLQKVEAGPPGKLYLACNRGFIEFDIASQQFTFLGGGFNFNIVDFKYDSDWKRIALVTEDGSLFVYDADSKQTTKIKPYKLPYPSTTWMEPDHEDNWLASPEGLINWIKKTNQFHRQSHLPQIKGGLLPGGVTSVFKSSKEVLWLGSPNGLSRFDGNAEIARFLPLVAKSFTDAINTMGSVLYDDIDNTYLVAAGMENKVFIIEVNGKVIPVSKDTNGEPLGLCNTLQRDGKGGIWLLTENSIFIYNRHHRSFSRVSTLATNRNLNFRAMKAMPDSTIWFATFGNGLWIYDIAGKKWSQPDAPYITSATSMEYDEARDVLWIGTFNNGLYSYQKQRGFKLHRPPDGTGYSLHSIALIHDLALDSNGRLLIATEAGGIFTLQFTAKGAEQWDQFSMRTGLSSNQILSVVSGNNGEIWAISGDKVHHLNSKGKNIYPLLNDRVMPITNHASDYRYSHSIDYNPEKNELTYASGGGLMIVPGARNPVPKQFPLVISEIIAGDNWKQLYDPASNDYLDVPYRHNSLQINYAALLYQPAGAIRYQHRLLGFDKTWVEPGGDFRAIYPNLPPGDYQFSIRAIGPDNKVVQQSPFFKVTIIPPVWRTWWFIMGVVLLLSLLFFYWIRGLQNNVHAQKILTNFATSLYGQNTVDDIFWDIARNCVGKLNFEDCVIYINDNDKQLLVQKAAFGPKSPEAHQIINPLEIAIGEGIVGCVAKTGIAEIINDTSKDSRYIVDDNVRGSEMAVPIMVDGKVFGVIDSENTEKKFYKKSHLKLMTRIAEIASAKISKYLIEERLRLKIARDLHDEMGSTLTSINIISKVAMDQSVSNPALSDQLKKIKDHSGRMMDTMSDIVWAINPDNDSFEKVKLRMKEFAAEILEPAGINYFFDEDKSEKGIVLNIEKRKELYMLFKEAITNAAKYSQATEVNIIIKIVNNRLLFTVVDNGIGFDNEQLPQGNGLRNMRKRAEQMKANFQINSIPGMGTSIQVIIPLT